MEEKTPKELLEEVIRSGVLKEESLKYIDNIIDNLVKLRELDSSSSQMWLTIIWTLFSFRNY